MRKGGIHMASLKRKPLIWAYSEETSEEQMTQFHILM